MKKNFMLQKAFKEVAENEIKALPEEEKIIRPFSDSFKDNFENIINSTSEKQEYRKRRKVKWAAIIAAVLAVCLFSVSVSAKSVSIIDMLKSLGFTFDEGIIDDSKYFGSEYREEQGADVTVNVPDSFIIDDSKYFEILYNEGKEVNVTVDIPGSYVKGEGMDEYMYLEYKGEPLTVKYTLEGGEKSEPTKRVVMLLVNGVRQTFDAKLNEKAFEGVDSLTLEEGELQVAELTFEPNIGKKGEEMALEVVSIFDPNDIHYTYCTADDKLTGQHWDNDNDNICEKCAFDLTKQPTGGPGALELWHDQFIKLIMKKNAPTETDSVCGIFSGAVESDLNEIIKESNDISVSDMETINVKVYQNLEEDIGYDEEGTLASKTIFKTTPKEDDKFTINVHGRPGKYRLAFYIGAEPQAVFDGKEYVDVEIKDGKQVELNISIDTTEFKEHNRFHIIYKHIGDDLFRENWWNSKQLFRYGKIIVE